MRTSSYYKPQKELKFGPIQKKKVSAEDIL